MIERVFKALRSEDRGQALIELALTLPLLLLFMLGAIELGRVTYAAIEVSNAARAAAQYAAKNGGAFSASDATGLDSAGMLTAAQADAGDLGNTVSFAASYPKMACSCSGSGSAVCSPVPPSGCSPPLSQVITTVTVQTKTSYDPLIYIPGWTHGAITLYGWAQEKVLPQ